MRLLILALALAAEPAVLAAQQPVPARRDTAEVRADTTVRRARGDSVRPRPPISPTGAFLRSLVLPGWGQARLNRNVTGGLFVAFEGLAAAMIWKTQWQLEFARARNRFVNSKKQEREDWIVLLLFNHLVAAAEAYVSAHLYDFPAALHARPLPGGRQGLGLTIPLR